MDDTTDQQTRIPGVRYRKIVRSRIEATAINGIVTTREVPEPAWEPVPPRDWDEVILRGVTGLAVVLSAIAVVGTTASVGGLLHALLPAPVAYALGVTFTSAWIGCLGLEFVNRVDPDRAARARGAGWAALVLSMGAVVVYGCTLHAPWAGVIGACVDLLSKGLWALLLHQHAVPLSPGVAHWLTVQEQEGAATTLLGKRLNRLDRNAAYQQAVGGPGYQAAAAILATTSPRTRGLNGRDSSGQRRDTPTPAVDPHPAPATATDTSGQAPRTVSGQVKAPEPAPAAPVPDLSGQAQAETAVPAAGTSGQSAQAVTEITRQPIAAICREAIAEHPKVSDADLVAAVKAAGHPDRPSLADTVRRTALRIDPSRKAS